MYPSTTSQAVQDTNSRLTPTQRKRRFAAYRTFDQARKATVKAQRISIDACDFGKMLCRLAEDRNYVFLTQVQLAEMHGSRRETVGSWLATFEALGLIWRMKRHGNRHRIYISSYEPAPELEPEPAPTETPTTDHHQLVEAAQTAEQTGDTDRAALLLYQAAMQLASSPALFFEASECDPTIALNAIQRSHSTYIKSQGIPDRGVNPPTPQEAGGGRSAARPRRDRSAAPEIPTTPTVEKLQAIGVRDPRYLIELANRDASEADGAIQAARRWHEPVRDFPGLVVWLMKYGLWRGRKAAAPPLDSADDPGGVTHFTCEHSQPRGACPQCYTGSLTENPESATENQEPNDSALDKYRAVPELPAWLLGSEEAC